MKKTLLTCLFFFSLYFQMNANQQETSIQWFTNYNQALHKSSYYSRPILLFFTGSDWCVWCQKLDKEVFNTQEFANNMGDKFIFVKLDYPMKHPLPESDKSQNESLKEKFRIRSYPTVILLDENENQIGVTGYRPGGAKEYGAHLLKIVDDFNSYHNTMNELKSD